MYKENTIKTTKTNNGHSTKTCLYLFYIAWVLCAHIWHYIGAILSGSFLMNVIIHNT